MNGNRASGLRRGYAGPSLHGDNASDQKGIAMKGDFRQASHTHQKIKFYGNYYHVKKTMKMVICYLEDNFHENGHMLFGRQFS